MKTDENIASAKGIAGLNVSLGLMHFAGKAGLYDKGLSLMYKKIAPGIDTARRLFESAAWQELGVHVHGLKGSLANIGAEDLAAQALTIERAGKIGDADTVKNSFEGFVSGLRALEAALAPIYGETPKAEGAQPNILADGLKKICEAASAFDYAGVRGAVDALLSAEGVAAADKAKLQAIIPMLDDFAIYDIEDYVEKNFAK
jgi:HPt (histidine-containing phosphotransfer) domain-containing protein